MRANGATLANCARAVGVSPNTLTKHYAVELDYGYESVRNKIGQIIVQKALAGDFKAAKFWLESRAGWGRRTFGPLERPTDSYVELAEQPPKPVGSAADLPSPGQRHASMTLGIGDSTIVVHESE